MSQISREPFRPAVQVAAHRETAATDAAPRRPTIAMSTRPTTFSSTWESITGQESFQISASESWPAAGAAAAGATPFARAVAGKIGRAHV